MSTAVALPTSEGRYNERQVRIIREQIAKGTSEDEFALFLEVCQMTGLNPFQRQIYAIMRGVGDKRKMTIQTGIDGYRLVAARTGQLAGIDDAVYDTEDEDNPGRASVTVWRFVEGHRVPFTATARWREYKPQPPNDAMWGKMPYLMLGKCAESLALRKAFPAELSGIYTGDEMAQADADMTPYVEAVPAPAATPTPIRRPPAHPAHVWTDADRKALVARWKKLQPAGRNDAETAKLRSAERFAADLRKVVGHDAPFEDWERDKFVERLAELEENQFTYTVDEPGEMPPPDPEQPHDIRKIATPLGA